MFQIFGNLDITFWGKKHTALSKLIIGKSQVFSTRSYVYMPGYTQGIKGLNKNQHVTVWNCFPSNIGMNLDQKIEGIYTSTWDLRNI